MVSVTSENAADGSYGSVNSSLPSLIPILRRNHCGLEESHKQKAQHNCGGIRIRGCTQTGRSNTNATRIHKDRMIAPAMGIIMTSDRHLNPKSSLPFLQLFNTWRWLQTDYPHRNLDSWPEIGLLARKLTGKDNGASHFFIVLVSS